MKELRGDVLFIEVCDSHVEWEEKNICASSVYSFRPDCRHSKFNIIAMCKEQPSLNFFTIVRVRCENEIIHEEWHKMLLDDDIIINSPMRYVNIVIDPISWERVPIQFELAVIFHAERK